MAWDILERFPNWGESGESPADGFFYEGGDQVNEKHLDFLWNNIKALEDNIRSALTEIDSDGDGKVDAADNADNLGGNAPSHYAADSDLSSHQNDTTNPHNVTDDQTGAASALSNHEGVSDAHHSRPSDAEMQSAVDGQIDADTVDGSHASDLGRSEDEIAGVAAAYDIVLGGF